LGAAGEINFLTGEEGWGFEEKSTQKFLHNGKKKKTTKFRENKKFFHFFFSSKSEIYF
jgi:hypothetical protein